MSGKRSVAACVLALTALSGLASAQTPEAPQKAADGPSLAVALELAQGAIAACAQKGYPISVSVLDSAGIVKVTLAADGAVPAVVESGTKKAATALKLKMATLAATEKEKDDKTLAASYAADPSLFVHPGGQLLMSGGKIIGAIGASGAPHESHQDDACLTVAIANAKGLQK
jgi:uncharacterized protein GlcG (DUF336 family)